MPRSDARVFLGMPSYGEVSAWAARAFWRATKLPDAQVRRCNREGSLLAANFNALWCEGLNIVHRGGRLDYWAMQHGDVEPSDWWLDALIDELEANDLDVLGVAVPIKDRLGLTSIALDRPDGDTWHPLCRLTMSDMFRMPETFTSEDIGRPILLNTGLWVCRFDPAWVKKVRFTINDRIVLDTVKNQYMPQCEPEDWYFSRLCHELGLKVGVTRKVQLTHRGPAAFANDRVWGQAFDSAWTDHSPVDDVNHGLFTMPNILGWLRYEEGKRLAELAKGKRVLEIGSYLGLSTVCLAREARVVAAMDWFDGRGTAEPRNTLPDFKANLDRFGVADRVRVVSPDRFITGDFDLVFIDGAHDRASVEADIQKALRVLADGGLIAFHDYAGHSDPGVTEAVDAFVSSGAELIEVVNSLAVVKPVGVLQES